jgi:3-dehydroquinate dehydratase-2
MRILVVNGPNLNFLGKREPQLYGSLTLDDIEKMLSRAFPDVTFEFYQSNIEGVLVEHVQKAMSGVFHGVLLNAGAYSQTSYALRDAVAMLKVPVIEVHLTNVYAREEFRHRSVIAPVCRGVVAGFGAQSYLLAAKALMGLPS